MNAIAPLPPNLPNIANAKLPKVYESAKTALAACSKLDECQDWADKSEALASYAKQAGDDSLRKMADKIQARAIQRCGDLLRQITPAKGKRNDLPVVEPRNGSGTKSRTEAATEAGLSKRQKDTALRVAAIPKDQFEELVESDNPPTVTELAELGKKAKPKPIVDLGGRDPEEFAASTQAQGLIHGFVAMTTSTDPTVVVRGALGHERKRLRQEAEHILAWVQNLVGELEEAK